MDRILLVDDDPLILLSLGRILEAEGYEVITHSDPLRALDETDFSVIISDFMMPRMNGIELLSRLRTHNPHGVRLMLTAAADFKVASQAVNRGEVYKLLSKPWVLDDLLTCVRQAVEHHQLVTQNEALTRELSEANAALVTINRNLERLVIERTNGLLDGMISALDHRDTETQWHSRRVSLFSRRIGEELGLGDHELNVIEQGALLHDIGKIGVRDSILHKAGPLSSDEWAEMRLHPEYGFRMLAKMPFLYEASLIVLQHQERYDGKGYPSAHRGEEIVLGARIFCVADTLDAIISDRPYRKGRPLRVARDEIRRCSGTQFDPMVVDAFDRVPDEDWIRIRKLVESMEALELKRWDILRDSPVETRPLERHEPNDLEPAQPKS